MRSSIDKQSKVFSFVYRFLIICLIFLGLVLFAGTIYGLFFSINFVRQEETEVLQKNKEGEQGQTFTGIGRIRASTSDTQPGMVIIFVSFIYYPEDKPFSEELVLRVKDFRSIIINYFASFSLNELNDKNEDDVKKELLQRFNSILRLGQIEALFFSDFMIIG